MRHLDWDGCFNVRDLGGLPADNGRTTRWGALVRADALDGLTEAGWEAVTRHGVRTVIDLRDGDERRPDAAPRPRDIRTLHIPLDGSGDREFWSVWRNGPQFGTPLYYRPHLEHMPERSVAVLAAIADAPPGGVVFHCGGGRDRAGQIAMLALSIAGVSPEAIASDYALSFERLPARYAAHREPDQGPVLQQYLAERGTTAEAVIVELLTTVDVPRLLRAAGLSDAHMERLRRRVSALRGTKSTSPRAQHGFIPGRYVARPMAATLTWLNEERCAVGDIVFQTLPTGWLGGSEATMEGADFFLMKDPSSVERFAALVAEMRPQHIFELGVYAGGSTALLCQLAAPRSFVAIDNRAANPSLREFIERRGLDGVVQVHDDVDQADRPRLAELADAAFGGEPLDLVVDDCSHLYEPTRTSFNELFPRLRSGGVYLIEDWPWAHSEVGVEADGFWPDEVPLTRLIFEIVLAVPSVPGLVSDVRVDGNSVRIRRGDARVDHRGFDIAECCKPRGRRLLA